MPFVINSFVSAAVVSGVLAGGGWRWGYGMFAIIMPGCLIPVIGSLFYGQIKAKKAGKLNLIPRPEKNFFKNPVSAVTIASKEMDVSRNENYTGVKLSKFSLIHSYLVWS